MPEPDYRLIPRASAQLALATNHLALLHKILAPMVLGAALGRPWEITDLALKLVWIESGTFLMGPRVSDPYFGQGPQTTVTLTQPFWLGRTAVTQGQYEAVMGNNPSSFTAAGKDAPVEQVSWDEAMAFCEKLTERERAAGILPAGYAYTLPTEAERDYACRAGTTFVQWLNKADQTMAQRDYDCRAGLAGNYAGDPDAMAWYRANSGDTTHPVGTKEPNAWGLYDMEGNVWEWCRDWYAERLGGEVTNPRGPSSGCYRVVRGGNWLSDAADCRSAFRYNFEPGDRLCYIGFRLALSAIR